MCRERSASSRIGPGWARFAWLAAVALLLSLFPPLVPSPALSQADPCPEPNNGFNNACFIGPRTPTVQGFIASATDVDAYKFQIGDPVAQVHIELSNLPADYDLYLFDNS